MTETQLIGDILNDTEEQQHPQNKFLEKEELARFRSSSAPPRSEEQNENDFFSKDPTNEDFRYNPIYYTYYQKNRLLNPRLPPPIVRDWRDTLLRNRFKEIPVEIEKPQSGEDDSEKELGWDVASKKQSPPSLVDRIQEDFPRTPSSVYKMQQYQDLNEQNQPSKKTQNKSQRTTTIQQRPKQVYFSDVNTDNLSSRMQHLNIHDVPRDERMTYPLKPQLHPQMQIPLQTHPIQPPTDFNTTPYGFYPQHNNVYPPQVYPTIGVVGSQVIHNPMAMVNRKVPPPFYQPIHPQPVQNLYQLPPEEYSYPTQTNGWEQQQPAKMTRRGKQQRQESDYYAPASKLMEEFKSGKGRKFELRDIAGHVVEFSRDQHGSRFIQQKLEVASASDKEMVFNEVYPEALNLMTDVFGNYVIQKFFEFGTRNQQRALCKVLKGHILALTLQTYGCRVIQKALDVMDPEDMKMIAEELNGHVMRCVQDQNGNHVIQKCIEKIPPKMIQFIVDSFTGNVCMQATHAYGCRVIQRILEYCTENQNKQILEEVLNGVEKLVTDQYGNYVVQHVLEHGKMKHKLAIINKLKGMYLAMSKHKYASNVVEKCFKNGGRKEKQDMIDEFCQKQNGREPAIVEMMKHQYANYVVQKMVELADDQQRKTIVDCIRPYVASIRRLSYGKHALSCIEKYEKI